MKTFLILALLAASLASDFKKFKDITEGPTTLLTKIDKPKDLASFDNLVQNHNSVVLFYMKWCGYWCIFNQQEGETHFLPAQNL